MPGEKYAISKSLIIYLSFVNSTFLVIPRPHLEYATYIVTITFLMTVNRSVFFTSTPLQLSC